MKTEPVDLTKVVDALEALRQELGRLGQRVAALEASAAAPARTDAASVDEKVKAARTRGADAATAAAAAAAATPPPAPAPAPAGADGLSEELVLVIGAAIAAFLGKKAHIRQIQLVSSMAWAQQGRVMIQASHALSVPTPRS